MPAGGWTRIFVGLVFAVLTPILLLTGILILPETLLRQLDPSVVAILVISGAIAWAAVLAVVYSRVLTQDMRSLLSLAQRGEPGSLDIGPAQEQLAAALDERNRQVEALAGAAGDVRIDDPRSVVGAVVVAVRTVMRDPTWRCAILASEEPGLLQPGVYLGDEDSGEVHPLSDLERWASVSATEVVSRPEGPWGAFAVVRLSVSDQILAILYAPWEGRPAPSAAERALLTLVGRLAATSFEHSLLYARVHEQAERLNRLTAVQADFLRGVSHDLQTPLTSIALLASELRSDETVPTASKQDLAAISHQAERLRRVVSQLLVASRIEAEAITPAQEVFAVRPLVDRTWDALRANRRFNVVEAGPAHLAVGDPDRFEQVLWAVLDNAVKYSPPGSTITTEIEPGEGELVVRVHDEGAGMDAPSLAQAFDQFYRSDAARKLVPDGSGVGLYAARGLMEAMGGSAAITSALGRGTIVTLRIPAEPSHGGA